jgi:phospholipase C
MAPQGPIEHVVVIFKENHCFDNYFGTLAGANGVALAHSPNRERAAGTGVTTSTPAGEGARTKTQAQRQAPTEAKTERLGLIEEMCCPQPWAEME